MPEGNRRATHGCVKPRAIPAPGGEGGVVCEKPRVFVEPREVDIGTKTTEAAVPWLHFATGSRQRPQSGRHDPA